MVSNVVSDSDFSNQGFNKKYQDHESKRHPLSSQSKDHNGQVFSDLQGLSLFLEEEI